MSSDPKRRKFTPRPPRPAEERLPKLYRGLTDQVNDGHFQNAIKSCKKILNLDPGSQAAFQTLLFLHLQTDDYTSALELVSDPKSKREGSLAFEKAYCLYRLHREKEALELLKDGDHGKKEMHLEAQIRYRLGEYETAQQVYDDLLASTSSASAEHDDIMTNIAATSAHLDFDKHTYHSHLTAPPTSAQSSQTAPAHIPTEGEMESYVPSLPTGWAKGSNAVQSANVKKPAASRSQGKEQEKKKKRRHPLPKGAVDGKPFTEDPDRWLPMRQRASYLAAQSKKKGTMTSMGTGITQGSTISGASGGASGGGGAGGKKKKGKK